MVRDTNYRRSHEWKKALRRRRQSRALYDMDTYPHLHQYSKNKVMSRRGIFGLDEIHASDRRRMDKANTVDE